MKKTKLSIQKQDFYINERKVYSDIPGSKESAHGLLMNARFIQGIFDDKVDPERFARFGRREWDPDVQTDQLIAQLPDWYRYGLRAFTVGLQGGGPCFSIDSETIDNNPFGEDGKSIDPAYLARLDKLIEAADKIGMVVIVSYFYGAQVRFLKDGRAIRDAVITASRWLKEKAYTNVMIEIANELDVDQFKKHKLIMEPEGMALLIDLAREESGNMPVGCSAMGGMRYKEVAEASDVVIIHGNGCSRQHYYNLIKEVQAWCPDKPVLCNEDSQAVGQLEVAEKTRTSWGYYNNLTKQEPPTDWSIQPGEDTFFALRMAEMIGIKVEKPAFKDQYLLQGCEPEMVYEGKRWIRLASLYPESINYVDFFRNNQLYYTCYDESFSVHFLSNWQQSEVESRQGDEWKAVIHLRNGEVLERSATIS